MSTFRAILHSRRAILFALVGAPFATFGYKARAAEAGISGTEIVLGQTNALSGPMSMFATVSRIEAAYFEMINASGGVNGRKLRLIALDDGFSPPKTVEQTRKLVEQEGVFAVISSNGTSTNSAVQKYLNSKGVPQLFLLSGAGRWNKPKEFPWSIASLAPYSLEAEIYAQYLMRAKPKARVGILALNDDSGKDMVRGFRSALGSKADAMIASVATYEITDPTVTSQILSLKASGADVLAIFCPQKAAAQALRSAYEADWHPLTLVFSISSAIDTVLKVAGPLDRWKGVLSAAVFKMPGDPLWADDPESREYASFLAKWYPEGNPTDFNNLYGYIAAQLVVDALRRGGKDLTREGVMKQASSFSNFRANMLLPGICLSNSPEDFVLFHQMQMQEFNGEKWLPVGRLIGG